MHTDALMHKDTGSGLGRLARRSGRPGAFSGAVLTVAFVALVATACSSGGSSAPNAATSKAAITTSYKTFFNMSAKDIPAMVGVIQDGASLKASVTKAADSSLAGSAQGSSVANTSILSASGCTKAMVPSPCAKVTYSILGQGGSALLGGETGYAVYVNNKWLVAKPTVCSLLGLFNEATGATGTPQGC
jgi:hypothetical protein